MKLTMILLTAAVLQVSATGTAQTVTFKGKNSTLQEVFLSIEKQTGFVVFCKAELLAKANKVNLDVSNMPLESFLKQVLRNQQLDYSIKNTTIFISRKTPGVTGLDPSFLFPPGPVTGRIIDSAGAPLAGASVRVKGTNTGTSTDKDGRFSIDAKVGDVLVISYVGFERYEVRVGADHLGDISLRRAVVGLEEVEVVNTGYQQLPKERATGSFTHISNKELNYRVSTNVLDRINGIASGVIFTPQVSPGNKTGDNKAAITIRDRSTINSNPNPLIIVDNMPFDGDLFTLNPNDIETIDILKDAAASSIWGAFAGNGVIVITTKKGKYNQAAKVSFNTNITVGNKPDLWYTPRISSSDYIDVERFLYSKGFYTSTLSSTNRPVVSPVVEILSKRAAGLITAADSASQIDALKNHDVRSDIDRYFYQKSVNQQYAINISGGGANNKYYFAAGFDHNKSNVVNNNYHRITLDAKNTYSFLKNKMEFSVQVYYNQNVSENNGSNYYSNIPYIKLADAQGKALAAPDRIRQGFIDTAGQGYLLDWNYRPLDELNFNDDKIKLVEYRINAQLKYNILPGLDASLFYYYDNGSTTENNYHSQQSYFTRDLINTFSQINFTTKVITYKVPLGGILDTRSSSYQTDQVRALVNYSHNWTMKHQLTALAGAEVKGINAYSSTNRYYGYVPATKTYKTVNYVDVFKNYQSPSSTLIPNNISLSSSTNNFLSYYSVAGYTYNNRYTLTTSVRKDESNIFGVNTNQKGVPLYSVGGAWNISKERFYNLNWLPYLKLRMTDGYSGNVNYSVSAYTTESFGTTNIYGAVQGFVSNPPNPELKWEKVNIINLGIDFNVLNRINGTIEYFTKKGKDLIGGSPIDPTTGLTTFVGNVANIRTKGVDVSITSKNIISKNFNWISTINFSYASNKVTSYLVKPSTISTFFLPNVINPLAGNPLYSVYAYQWAGLDSIGNPQAMLDKQISKAYASFPASGNFDNMKYMGSATPPYFGNLLNTVNWKQLSLTFNIIYKFGYFFRNPYVTAYFPNLYNVSGGFGFSDYSQRWQKPGDEKITNVPSIIYPDNTYRDQVYANANINVLKGDHIRLQFVSLAYNLSRNQIKKLPFQSASVYINANNLGIIWKANDKGLDPDALGIPGVSTLVYPSPFNIAAGVKVDF